MQKVIVIMALAVLAAEAAIAGTITGVVTSDSNGQPIQGLWVYACDYTTNEYLNGGNTDSNGSYSISGLAEGTYRIRVSTGDSNYVEEYYNNAFDYESAAAVYVASSGVTQDINFGLETGGTVSGTIVDSNGQPIVDMPVNCMDYQTNRWVNGTTSDANGQYAVQKIPAGTYIVMVWAEQTIYASEYYDNKISQDTATPVSVSAGQQTTGIDFSIDLGALISGIVKNSSDVGQANVQVNCWADNGYGTGAQTEANGFYKCGGLPVGYNYNVVAYPPAESNYMITRITVYAYQPGEYTDEDIVLGDGGLKISGRVTDKATALPLANVRVGLWNDDFEIWSDTRTDTNGMYLLANLPPGVVDVSVEPDSYYAYMGIDELELEEDINNLDFALPAGAILSGRVLDANTAQPLAGVEIEYSSEEHSTDKSQFTDVDGSFCLTQLPPGIAEVKARPDADSGYAWNLPWGSDLVCLNEGENRPQQIITLEKGALVRGHIKDADGNAFSHVEYYYSGRKCDGWSDADVNGFYQIRLPVGIYVIAPDNTDEFGALPAIVTITDENQDVNVPDLTFYTEETGGQISGDVNNPGEHSKTGYFVVLAFLAGTTFNSPDALYTAQPVSTTGMENALPFSLSKLPPDANYDIYLCVDNRTADMESLAVRDAALNVAVGTTGIILDYNSQGGTVRGSVTNNDDLPVLGAIVALLDSSGGFGGFADTDCNGGYTIYNVPAGTYTVVAGHSKYLFVSTTAQVVEEATVDVNTLTMPFAGEKEGADLNGDGVIDMLDVAEFCGTWLADDLPEGDFNQDSRVNFDDWARLAENWLSRAIWLHE
jgi:hypothetical protein